MNSIGRVPSGRSSFYGKRSAFYVLSLRRERKALLARLAVPEQNSKAVRAKRETNRAVWGHLPLISDN